MQFFLTPFIVLMWGITLIIELQRDRRKRRREKARRMTELLTPSQREI